MKRRMKPRELREKMPAKERCGPTGKWRYRSPGAAEEALVKVEEAAKLGDARRREKRHYWCIHCDGFHLTSTDDHRSKAA